MQPLPPPVPGPLALLDTTEGFARRKKTSLWFVGSLLVVSTSILTVGLAATTRTENVTMGGYYPGIILGFGSFLGIIGINLVENRKQMLVAAIVFVSFGVVAAFCCAIVDGVFAARHIEPRPLTAGRCQFYSSGVGYLHDTYQTEVTCHSLNGRCQLKVKSNTCYCCDLYDCHSTEHPPTYYEFVGVRGCQDVLHLYRLLWASAALNVLGLFLGVVTAAVLGAFKDMVPLSQLAYGPSTAPQALYNPAQQILASTGFCPLPPAVPTCSSYPLPLQVPHELAAVSWPEQPGMCQLPGPCDRAASLSRAEGLPALTKAAAPWWLPGLTWLRPLSVRGCAASVPARLQLPAPPECSPHLRPHPLPPRGEASPLRTVMQRVETEN